MKRTLFLHIFIVFLTTSFLFIFGCNNQNMIKEQSSQPEKKIKGDSELQEQCKKNAAALFKKEYGKGYEKIRDGSYMSNYTNHYNVKLNKCFVLVKITYVPNSKKEDALIMKDLSDTNENKQYGSFGRFRRESIPISCSVENRICKSEAEWDSLVKYFMEE
jgi:hypothetical protein